MARLPYVTPETAAAEVRETLERLPAKLNVFRMMAHAETNFRPLVKLGTSILSQQKLSAKLRELAILRVANLSKAEYEWVQHVSFAELVGVPRPQIDALERGAIHAECFDATEQLVLEFATEVIRDVRASDATLARMQAQFSSQEIVELLVAVGFYMLIARLLETTGVDIEPPSEGMADQARKWQSAKGS